MIEILSAVAIVYAGVVGVAFTFQRSMLYYPDTSAPSLRATGLKGVEEIVLQTSDQLSLMAWYQRATAGNPTLVLFHGNAGHIGHRGFKIGPYLDAGYGVLLVEYRGYGGNPGKPSEQGLYKDGRAALDFLDRQKVPASQVVLYGESLGSGIVVQMALERKVGALILEAPFTSVADVAGHHYAYLPTRWLTLDRFDNLAKISSISAPILVIHGEQDNIVPVRFGRALFEAATGPKEIQTLPQSGHNDMHPDSVYALVAKFLSKPTLEQD